MLSFSGGPGPHSLCWMCCCCMYTHVKLVFLHPRALPHAPHVDRGVSRKARRHIVKVRMPQNSRGGGGKSSPAATETRKSAGETTSQTVRGALENTDPCGGRAKGRQQQERSGGDDCAAAVAVRVCTSNSGLSCAVWELVAAASSVVST